MTPGTLDIPSPLASDPQMLGATMAPAGAGVAAELERAAKGEATDGDEVRENLKQLVAETFIAPLMKMARNDPFKSDLFHGGAGEDVFGQQLDQEMTKRLGNSMRLPFVDKAYEQFTRRMNLNQGGDAKPAAADAKGVDLRA